MPFASIGDARHRREPPLLASLSLLLHVLVSNRGIALLLSSSPKPVWWARHRRERSTSSAATRCAQHSRWVRRGGFLSALCLNRRCQTPYLSPPWRSTYFWGSDRLPPSPRIDVREKPIQALSPAGPRYAPTTHEFPAPHAHTRTNTVGVTRTHTAQPVGEARRLPQCPLPQSAMPESPHLPAHRCGAITVHGLVVDFKCFNVLLAKHCYCFLLLLQDQPICHRRGLLLFLVERSEPKFWATFFSRHTKCRPRS